MNSTTRLQAFTVSAIGALALAATFPKVGAVWLAPLGAAALFWAWQGSSLKRSVLLGWFAGEIFFAITFAWWSSTIVHYVGVLAYLAVLAGAAIEATAWALAGVLVSLAYRNLKPAVAPLAAAAAFAFCEWFRSVGLIGAPLAQLGYTQAGTPLRIFAAYGGTYGITFVICLTGAYLADAVRRRRVAPLAVTVGALAAAWIACWAWWPAKTLAPATIPVAAIQGNVAQSLKWSPAAFALAVERYIAMTHEAAAGRPDLIVWPETVITTDLSRDPALAMRISASARDARSTVIAGSLYSQNGALYNALYFFAPDGGVTIYRKRQLVPFAESFPGRTFLWWLPYVGTLGGGFASGDVDGVYTTTALRVAPLICWESAFSDLAFQQVRRGAQLFVVSTDDGWFGTSAGPYQHAEIARLRAIEYGTYVVRAAATGISGIIAPDGSWSTRIGLDRQAVAVANVGPPVRTPFATLGPTFVATVLAAIYAICLFFGRRREDL
ncbi:MAG: apolipoprotein N-acyltransferase [Vulcanimicrobiaceae bacterium]